VLEGAGVNRSLGERLSVATSAGAAPAVPLPPAAPVAASRLPAQLEGAGWRAVAPFVYCRDSDVPSPLALPAHGVRGHLLPDQCDLEHCLFWDTETTGLGGAGTVIFLVGFAWLEGTRLRFHQVFLADFPGERRFLEYLRGIISRYEVFVSYNGKAFDSTILKTRLVLSGMTMALGYQLDLLYLARRFWRRITGNCRLTTIEQEVLGLERAGDVPGWMVPDIYFDSLRRGVLGELPVVFRHNEADVITLARLLAVVDDVLGCAPDGECAVPVDLAAVGAFLLQRDDPRGPALLRRAYAGGDEEAGRLLSLYLKRAGDWRAAVPLWEDLRQVHGSCFAAVELSKFYEHRARDLEAALACITPFLGDLMTADRGRREARIRAKLQRAPAGREPVS
jgi:uncharacterized protein YprB with RNaseH-like and TPR domain